MTPKRTQVGTIDCTPTWTGMVPLLITLLQQPGGSRVAEDELRRMAKLADAQVAAQRAAK